MLGFSPHRVDRRGKRIKPSRAGSSYYHAFGNRPRAGGKRTTRGALGAGLDDMTCASSTVDSARHHPLARVRKVTTTHPGHLWVNHNCGTCRHTCCCQSLAIDKSHCG